MKIRQQFMAISATAFLLSVSFPAAAAQAPPAAELKLTEEAGTQEHRKEARDVSLIGPAADPTGKEPAAASPPEEAAGPSDEAGVPVPDDAPAFHARIEYRMGYTVIGTFTDFTPDITRIQPLYSLDGENWQAGTRDWNLYDLETDDESRRKSLQNQPCLYNADEPLKSYIAGETDQFYLKLRVTGKNGLSYDTQPAVIARGGLQPIPEGTACRACFSSAITVREPAPAPYRYRRYGRYQLTVSADATAEEISALLPDTLPVEVQLDRGPDFLAIGTIDCPVTWKPLSLPPLSAGESITIADAAEEILIPAGTPVSTPIGIFVLNEPPVLNMPPSTDEVKLVLNVSPEEDNPTGVLKEDRDGLKIALRRKPTGATSIQAYLLTEGAPEWTKLSGLSLLEEINSQPSTESSGFALVLRSSQEPYHSYLAAREAGTTPTPFFISLKFEGGIYDGRQLTLAWPDIYEQLPDLPEIHGGEGNENNAGTDNKGDSTEGGQRPDLPQGTDEKPQEEQPVPGADGSGDTQQPEQRPDAGGQETQQPVPGQSPDGDGKPQGGAGSAPDGDDEPQGGAGQAPDDSDEPQGGAGSAPDGTGEPQGGAGQATGDIEGVQIPGLSYDGGLGSRKPARDLCDSLEGRRPAPGRTPETVFTAPEIQSAPDADGSPAHPPDHRESPLLSGQRPNLPQTAQAAAGTINVNRADSPDAAPPEDEPAVPVLSDTKTVPGQAAKPDRHLPLLPVATALLAGLGIGTALWKARGAGLFHRIAGSIREFFPKYTHGR